MNNSEAWNHEVQYAWFYSNKRNVWFSYFANLLSISIQQMCKSTIEHVVSQIEWWIYKKDG